MVLDGNKIGLYSVFPVEGKFPEELKLCETEEFLRNYPYGIRIAGRSGERREEETILDLPPKNLVLGIGCLKGISECVSSHSEFVRKVTGVDNVCERAAILAAGEDGRLLMPKQCMNRVTIAVAEKKVRIRI